MMDSFQRFVDSFCPSACVPVDLVKIARNVLFSNRRLRGEHGFGFQTQEIISNPLCLLMDGECCLDRLYGGYFGDWVCGGQWNRAASFLRTFFQVASENNIEITVFFNGALELNRMNNWVEKQLSDKEKINQVIRHISCKGTPPPKVWWIAPYCLRSCLRIILRHLQVNVVLSTTDHHQEVMSYLKKYNFHGLLADDSDYIIFDPPRYFSATQLKLTLKGCMETKEYILNEVTRCLNLHPSRICIVAALLGNHILTTFDLDEFHHSLCPKTNRNVNSNLTIKAIVEYVRNLHSVDNLDEIAWKIFGTNSIERCEKFKQCVKYYSKDNHNFISCAENANEKVETKQKKENYLGQLDNGVSKLEASVAALSLKHNCEKFKDFSKTIEIPHLPQVSAEVLQKALERHQKGIMHPYIYQILYKGQIKIPLTFEDDINQEIPSPTSLYRPLRQSIYAILFNHHHLQCVSEQNEKEGVEKKIPDIFVKEWTWSKTNNCYEHNLVPSLPLDWPVPTIWRLWFGNTPEDNKRRFQAFLSCMRSNNSPSISDPAYIPQHLILFCCILRYLMSHTPFLYKYELDAFLVQAVDLRLTDTEYTQALEIPAITPRGIMLSALITQGIDFALMANDACGAPISWLMCCPSLFFDGKLFHYKLHKASSVKNLLELCENRYEDVSAVECMRNAILERLSFKFLTPPLLQRPSHSPFSNFHVPVQCPLPLGRGRGHQPVVSRGGRLEVAGVVVGSWGPNFGRGHRSSNVPPQIVSVGGRGRRRPGSANSKRRGLPLSGGRNRPSSPPSNSRNQLLGIGRGVRIDNSQSDFDFLFEDI